MKQKSNMRYLHMGCGESLAASQGHRVNGLNRTNTVSQKTEKTGKTKRRKGNEGGR